MALAPIEGLEALSGRDLDAWLEAMRARGYDDAAIERLDQIGEAAPDWVRRRLAQWRLDLKPEPPLRLALLFADGGRLPRAEVEDLLGAGVARALLEARALGSAEDGRIESLIRVKPFLGLWIVADGAVDDTDSVMPTGPATAKLGECLPERIAGAALDVGCGPGGLALVAAARGARRAFGTDLNARAVAMSRFNARLNHLEAEFRVGDLVAPVAGQRFDVVVSQPPYILQPPGERGITYLHGGPRGDAVTRRLLHSLAGVLTRRGEALVMSDVPLRPGESMRDYLEKEIGAAGVNLLALHAAAPSPEMHSLIYSSYAAPEPREAYLEAVQRHIAQFESLGITELRHTLFSARRPAEGATQLFASAIAVRGGVPVTAAMRDRLWASVRGADAPDAALLGRRVRVAPDAEWVSRRPDPEGEMTEHRVRFGPGWPGLEQIVPEQALELASLLQRSARVAEAVAGYAEWCDSGVEEVRAPVLRYVRDGLVTGMLVFDDPADPAPRAGAGSRRGASPVQGEPAPRLTGRLSRRGRR